MIYMARPYPFGIALSTLRMLDFVKNKVMKKHFDSPPLCPIKLIPVLFQHRFKMPGHHYYHFY